jgi:beta-aspartyl-peptidase (threonine type)
MNPYAIAVHGGAGTILRSSMTPEKEAAYKQGLLDAIMAGEAVLKKKARSVEAVEMAIRTLEDNPLFNAGKGAVFTNKGKNEMDASIMNGRNFMAGAVAGVRNIKNPISLAKAVMEKSEHVFLSCEGAMKFAELLKIQREPDEYFFATERFEQLKNAKARDTVILDHHVGTVGAVALDVHGNLAAGTSTGGMTNKKFGRIGDSPMIGAGTYANNTTCAISCTGHGEYFIRAVVAHDVSCLIEYKGLSLKEACNIVVQEKLVQLGGEGGLIALDSKGNIELVFNSEGMYRAMKRQDGDIYTAIYKE